MPWIIPLVGTGISALAGLFGGKNKQQDTTSTQQTSGTSTTTSTPQLSGLQEILAKLFSNAAAGQLQSGSDLSGFTSQGLQNINNTSNLRSKTVSNLLASRGLSYSPAAVTALTAPESEKLNQSSQFLNSIPLLQRQMHNEDIGTVMKAFGLLPTSVTNTGTTNTQSSGTGQQVQQGNPLAGLFSGAGSGMYASGLAGILSSLFGGGRGGGGLANDNLAQLTNQTMKPWGT